MPISVRKLPSQHGSPVYIPIAFVSRRKKCIENTLPVCGACARLNLECVRQEKRDVVPETWASESRASGTSRATPPVSSTSLSTSQRPLSLQLVAPSPSVCTFSTFPVGIPSSHPTSPCMGSSQMRKAMSYYISVLASHLTVSGEFNSFLTGSSSPFCPTYGSGSYVPLRNQSR